MGSGTLKCNVGLTTVGDTAYMESDVASGGTFCNGSFVTGPYWYHMRCAAGSAESATPYNERIPVAWWWDSDSNGAGYAPPPTPPPSGGPIQVAETYGSGGCGAPKVQQDATSKPVNTATGNFWHSFDDLAIPGRGPGLGLSRTFNSLDTTRDGWFGAGWASSYETFLTPSVATATVMRANGTRVTFENNGGSWVAPPWAASTLVHNGDGTWTFRCHAQDIYTFDSTGRLTAITDRNGYATTLSYPSGTSTVVTDAAGRTLTFTFTGTHVTSVTDSATPARSLTYTYNGAGDLTDVVDVGGGHWVFTYDGSHRMMTMRAPKYFGDTTTTPSPVTTNHYDAQGRIDWQSDELGRTTSLDYTTMPGSTIVTDPKGNKVRYEYTYGILTEEERGYGLAGSSTWAYEFDPVSTATTKVTDPNGHEWSATYDADGNKLSGVDPLTRTSSATYNVFNEPLTVTDGKNITTTMTYDANGNLLSRSTPWVEGPQSTNQVTTYHYDDGSHPGDVTSMTDPAGKTWMYTYDSAGNRNTSADPLGNTTRACYDSVGRPTAVISPRGVAAGVTCATTPPAAHTTYFTYNAYGDVLTSKDPLGHITTRTYDANRQPATLLDPTSQTTTYTFDRAGQPTQTLRPDSTVTKTDFWGDGTIKAQWDGANHHSDYAYDSQGRLTSITDPLSRVTSFGYDAAGNRTTKQDPGGNCAAVPKTGCATFSYDNANQMTGIDYSDASTPDVSNLTYDGVGHRTGMTDGSGTTTYTWDSLGRMTSSVAPSGTVGYTWDLRNLQTGLAYPNSIGSVTSVFDDAGRLTSITDWLSHTTGYGYDADGNLASQTNPNGTTATITVDNADRVMGVSHAPTATPGSPFASFSYGRDNENKLTSLTSTGVPADNHAWGYSTIDQVTSDSAKPFPYTYDTADNLTQPADGTAQAFDVANQLTSSSGISLVGTGGAANGNSASAAVSLPGGIVANDQILLSAVYPTNKSVTTPTGYTLVKSWTSGSGGTGTKLTLFRKTAVGGETSVSVRFSATFAKTITAAVYRGVNTTTPIEVSSSVASSTNTVVMPSITPTLANSKLVAVLGATQGGSAGAVWAAPSGMVKQVEQSVNVSDGAIADQRLTAAGATGTRTATLGTTGKLVGVLLALKPAVTTFGYDTRGHRTTRTAAATTTYGYNQANRLVSHANGTTTTYTYNGDGLRVGRGGPSSTTFRWDLAGSVPMLLVDGTTAYVYGPDGLPVEQINGSTVLYYHHDQLGSTRAVTNSAGTVVATYSYDSYGNLTGSTGSITNPFGFAGEYRDSESGLIYLRARFYDPATGQFLNRDPMESMTGEPYAYARNNPLNFTDPTGLCLGPRLLGRRGSRSW